MSKQKNDSNQQDKIDCEELQDEQLEQAQGGLNLNVKPRLTNPEVSGRRALEGTQVRANGTKIRTLGTSIRVHGTQIRKGN